MRGERANWTSNRTARAAAGAGRLLVRLARDDRGGEVLEYALIAGLIVVAAIAAITSVGSKVLARWTSLNASV